MRRAREREFVADTCQLAEVRTFLRETVEDQEAGEAQYGEFVVTELATNAILHAGSGFTVRIGFTPTLLRIEVADASDAPPRLGRHQPAIHGLEMVDKLANDWGYELHDEGGKTVWAEVPLRGRT